MHIRRVQVNCLFHRDLFQLFRVVFDCFVDTVGNNGTQSTYLCSVLIEKTLRSYKNNKINEVIYVEKEENHNNKNSYGK